MKLRRSGLLILALIMTVSMTVTGFGGFGGVFVYAEDQPQAEVTDPEDLTALEVYRHGELLAGFSIRDLENIAAEEGNRSYTYSAYNRNVSYKGDQLKNLQGPTIRGILAAAGEDIDAEPAGSRIRFTAYDTFATDFYLDDLFAERCYFPNGQDDSYRYGGAVSDSSREGAQPVEPILQINREDAEECRVVFGQEEPNEQNYTNFVKYMLDLERMANYARNQRELRVSSIDIESGSVKAWNKISKTNVKSGSRVAIGKEIKLSYDPDAMNVTSGAPFYWIYYTDDKSAPGVGDSLYNYDRNGSTNPYVICKPGTTYLKVRVTGHGRPDSSTTTFKYIGYVAKPSSFAVAAADYKTVNVKWKVNDYVTGYKVYRYYTSKKSKQIADIKTADIEKDSEGKFTYRDENRITGKSYKYKVKAYVDYKGKKTYGSFTSARSAKPVLTRPVIEDMTSSYDDEEHKVEMNWSDVDGAKGYALYRSTSKTKNYKKISGQSYAPDDVITNYTDTAVKGGRTYYYKVKVYRVVKGKKVYSSYSKIWGIKSL